MTGYIVQRMLLVVPTVFLVVTLTFFLMHIVPGDAVLAQIEEGTNLRPEQMELMRERLGLNQPLYVQYGQWLWGLLHLDAGVSLFTGRPVSDQLLRAIPISIELIVFSQFLSITLAIPIGVISAIRQDTWLDYLLRTASIGMLAAPSFWIATLVLIFGAYWFLWAPPFGYVPIWKDPVTNLQQFLIPSAIIGLSGSATKMRMTRSMVLEVLRQDYVRTARAKGLSERVIMVRHVLKNSLIPVITIWGASIAGLVNGSIIIENIFGLPGVGRSMIQAINNSDITQLQINVLFYGFAIMLINLIVDISYTWFDPRVRYR
ncbi:MAG: ABC transporter permease [Chloroflexi bacterium]|nr:ABC transporter permease [Chloroflexota bacterium]